MNHLMIDSLSEADTVRIGAALVEALPDGTTVALCGTLGAGKTRLVQAMAAVFKRLSDRTPRTIELRDIPVVQCIPRILAALAEGERTSFASLFETVGDRALVIATFIALLELMRRGAVRAWQDERGGAIYLGRGERFATAAEPAAASDEAAAPARENSSEGEPRP